MPTVTIQEAQAQLPDLIHHLNVGDEFGIKPIRLSVGNEYELLLFRSHCERHVFELQFLTQVVDENKLLNIDFVVDVQNDANRWVGAAEKGKSLRQHFDAW